MGTGMIGMQWIIFYRYCRRQLAGTDESSEQVQEVL